MACRALCHSGDSAPKGIDYHLSSKSFKGDMDKGAMALVVRDGSQRLAITAHPARLQI